MTVQMAMALRAALTAVLLTAGTQTKVVLTAIVTGWAMLLMTTATALATAAVLMAVLC